ncbi:MAG: hypothetical protein ACN4E2_04140 [Nitrospinota bacterium]
MIACIESEVISINIFEDQILKFSREIVADIDASDEMVATDILRALDYWGGITDSLPINVHTIGSKAYNKDILDRLNALLITNLGPYEFNNSRYRDQIKFAYKGKHAHLIGALL